MTKVFVHGVPESTDVWTPLLDALAARGVADVVTLSPPGFGAPGPEWDPTAPDYAAWLITELSALDAPIDVVGHDWGAGHVFATLAERPDLVRSWAADVAGLVHHDYVWHDMAQAWQQPDVGEQVVAGMVEQAQPDRAVMFESLGLSPAVATAMAGAVDAEMGRCILALYRSAVPPYLRDLGDRLAATPLPPGLVVNATADPYVAAALGVDVATRLGAEVLTLDDQGHWWMNTAPDDAADGLLRFWESVS